MSLKKRILKRLVLTGLILSALMLAVLLVAYRKLMETEQTRAAVGVSRLLQSSLENAMLKRDVPGLAAIVSHLGEQPGICSVMILNPAGEIRFASDPALVGTQREALLPPPGGGPITDYALAADGQQVLRSITPVRNQAACVQCHGPLAAHPVNGILVVDYDAAPAAHYARMGTLLLVAAGLAILALLMTVVWRALDRAVLHPVGKLAEAARQLHEGHLDERVDIAGDDEIARLGQTFNRMADEVQHQMARVRAHQRYLQDVLDSLPDGLRVIRLSDMEVVMSNRAMLQQLGFKAAPEAIKCYAQSHRRQSPCVATMVICPALALAAPGDEVKCTHHHVDQAGREFAVEVHAARLELGEDGERQAYIVESVRDLSTAASISHEQRLGELGFLAAGIAHEIHNPLGSIRLAVEGLARDIRAKRSTPEQTGAYLDSIDSEVDNCITVTRRLLLLSRAPSENLQVVDINAVMEDTARLLDYEALTRRVRQTLHLQAAPLQVLADDPELRMMFLNLLQNAHHAMPEGGEITITTGVDGERARVDIRDTGVGIAPERIARIFDPFYSARADGSTGTGLGLTIVKSIAERLKGDIQVSSVLGQGTTFTLRLPLATTALDAPC